MNLVKHGDATRQRWRERCNGLSNNSERPFLTTTSSIYMSIYMQGAYTTIHKWLLRYVFTQLILNHRAG